MKLFRFAIWVLFALSIGGELSLDGQDALGPREHHPWMRWRAGSWKRVKDTSETLDKGGTVTGVTTSETRTTLSNLEEGSYTLCVETQLEVAGKHISAPPKYSRYGQNGELPDQNVTIRKVGETTVEICGKKVPTEIRQITVQSKDTHRVSEVYYSEQVPPYVLRRDTMATDADGKQTKYESHVEVVAFDMPYKVMDDLKSASYVRTVQKQPNGTTTIVMEVHCPDVPGGIVMQTTKKLDQAGNVTERRTQEVLEFEALRGDDSSRVGHRRILPRNRRP